MSKEETKEIEHKILTEIKKTQLAILEYKEMAKPVEPDNAIGRISRMDAINNKSVAEAALRKAEEKLKKLKYVKSQVGKEGFGICIKCNKPIPTGRILLVPQSNHCVNCAN